MDIEPFVGRSIVAGIGCAGIPAPDWFGRVEVPGEKRTTSGARWPEDTEAPTGVASGPNLG